MGIILLLPGRQAVNRNRVNGSFDFVTHDFCTGINAGFAYIIGALVQLLKLFM